MSLPNKMKAVLVDKDKALQINEIDVPLPQAGQVLIRSHYSGVNRPDILQRKGLYPPPANASPLLGLEVSGEIAAIGENCGDLAIGDKVCALLNGGGYAEYAIAEAGHCLSVPKNIDMAGAAALPETMLTVFTNVFEDCSLQADETILIHGGASGIGVSAIQMANAIGAKVIVTVGSDEKAAFCEKLGAVLAINYKTQDFEEIIKAKGGVDVILDMVGGPYIQKNINILNDCGRLSFIAFLQGAQANINFMRLMLKRIKITGSTLRSRSNIEKSRITKEVHKRFFPLIENGTYRPIIHEIIPFGDVEKAHAIIEASQNLGKIVLRH